MSSVRKATALSLLTVFLGCANAEQMERQIAVTDVQMTMLKQNIDMYDIGFDGLPESLEQLRDGPSDPAKRSRWDKPILTEIPTDAWGQQLQYTVDGNSFEIRSGGPDRQLETDDDLIIDGKSS